jgi:uncharacterized protein YdbL (DUF1318 family)
MNTGRRAFLQVTAKQNAPATIPTEEVAQLAALQLLEQLLGISDIYLRELLASFGSRQ